MEPDLEFWFGQLAENAEAGTWLLTLAEFGEKHPGLLEAGEVETLRAAAVALDTFGQRLREALLDSN